MKKILHIFMWMFTFVMLTGCAKFEPQDDAVLIDRDEKITRYFIDTFVDESNQPYSQDEIRKMMETELKTYNRNFGVDHVVLQDCAVENDVLTMTLLCDSARYYQDYCSYFNDDFTTKEADVVFFVGTLAEAGDYSFDAGFVNAAGETVSVSDILKKENLKVVILNEALEVSIPKKILYVSDNVEILGKNQAKVQDSGLMKNAYILYK